VLLDVRVVNVALPAGQTELGGSFDELRWIIAPDALALVATMLTNHDRRMTMPVVSLSAGLIHYQKTGPPDGRPVVFVHGYAMGASLLRPLTERLAARGFLCVAPTWPLGAHSEPMREDAELTMEGIAAIIAETLDSLELDNVVLVGNDTGGAISQIVATTRPQRVGALVLTSCDAFEHFPPPVLKPLIAAAKMGPAFDAAIQPLRTRIGRKRAFGALAHAAIDPLVREWVKPALSNRRSETTCAASRRHWLNARPSRRPSACLCSPSRR
jgi:pimeloyl-ACP methyl ester carboxylesterase